MAFGGIAGLFLGCSILSGVELIYYIFNFLFNYIFLQHKISKLSQKSAGYVHDDNLTKNKVGETEKKFNGNMKVLRIQYVKEADQNKYLY